MFNLKNKTIASLVLASMSLTITSAFAVTQQQGTGARVFSPMIEISAGLEAQDVGVSSSCRGDCGPGHAVDNSRGGPMIRFGFAGISATELRNNNTGMARVMFLPISMIVDMGAARGDGFGRVMGFEGTSGHIRQVIGALVEANVNPVNGHINLRGKLAQVEYNRDKGIWDWRAIDASVGVGTAVRLGGETTLNIEVDVGGGVGGVHLNGMADLMHALSLAPTMENAITVNPYAAVRAGIRSSSLKVELVISAEQRVDMTPTGSRPTFGGHQMGVDSSRLMGTAEVEYTFGGNSQRQMGNRFSIFVDGGFDFDTLTLSHVMFGSNDAYRSFMLMGGVRVQF